MTLGPSALLVGPSAPLMSPSALLFFPNVPRVELKRHSLVTP